MRLKMLSKRTTRRALTLVEMTIILSVISILSAVLVPTVMSHITQSRIVRAQQDVRTIGDAIVRLFQDTGRLPTLKDAQDSSREMDLLVSNGATPQLNSGASDVAGWVTGSTDKMENHLVNNAAGYDLKYTFESIGWNGPYISSEPAADPWGNRYMVNVAYLEATPGVLGEDGGLKRAVFVVSSGQNGTIETPFQQPLTDVLVGGDDIVHRVQ